MSLRIRRCACRYLVRSSTREASETTTYVPAGVVRTTILMMDMVENDNDDGDDVARYELLATYQVVAIVSVSRGNNTRARPRVRNHGSRYASSSDSSKCDRKFAVKIFFINAFAFLVG